MPLALITGAGLGGIGFSVARALAKRSYKVILADIDTVSLFAARDALLKEGADVQAIETDVSSYDSMLKLKNAVKGPIDFLLLNAGVQVSTKDFAEDGAANLEAWTKTLSVNLFGVLNGTQVFVEGMVAQGNSATIVITGSKQGITCPPGNPAYNTSKAAVKALAESLSFSLRQTPINVHLLVPGYTYTKLTTGGKASLNDLSVDIKGKPDAAWTCDQVADYMFASIAKKDFYIICPDGAVTEKLDLARMTWTFDDILKNRQPLSRWREENAEVFEQHVQDYLKKN